jgi:threonine-phosphate decarboxylase
MISFSERERIPAHGGQLQQVAVQFGIPQEKLLDFSANINPNGPPENVLSDLREMLSELKFLKEYPDSEYRDLKKAFADYAGVLPSDLVVANGVIPLLEASLRATKVTKCLLPVPAFSEYRKMLDHCGVEVIPYRLSAEHDFKIDLQQILSAMLQNSCDALLLTNPQNPSGVALSKEEIQAFLEDAVRLNVQVFLDEAFIDYLPEESLTSWISTTSRMIVFRSVTKFFALAGMRVAFAITNAKLVRKIEGFIPEWPVTTLAAKAAQSALESQSFFGDTVRENRRERAWLKDQLKALGLTVYPGQANFLLFRIPDGVNGEVLWLRLIQEHHIVIRHCGNFDSLDRQFLRAAIRKRNENCELVGGLRTLLLKASPCQA